MIKIIAAIDFNNVIGKDNKLLWNIPEDMKHFRRSTIGHAVLMGRKTFESIGKPLDKRLNIILTRNHSLGIPKCILINDIGQAVEFHKEINTIWDMDLFIIGGSEIYQQFIPIADTLIITEIQDIFEGNKYFPKIDKTMWELSKHTIGISELGYELHYKTFIRK